MVRLARAVAIGYPHHVTQRGNYRQTVFETDTDYLQYLEWLKEYCAKYDVVLWAYCLMTNHVHFICVPERDDSLARTFNSLHMRYSQYVNRRRRVKGHLWQGRFYSTILDEAHLYEAVRYVETNPVRGGIVGEAEDYRWSSAREHVEGTSSSILSGGCYLVSQISSWRKYLGERVNERLRDEVRKCSLAGRPCGDETFIKRLERAFGRPLKALPRGRPRKSEK